MDHIIDALYELAEVRSLGKIGVDNVDAIFEGLQVLPFAGGKIVDDRHRFTAANQFFHNVRPDEPPAARDNVRCHPSPPKKFLGRQTISRILYIPEDAAIIRLGLRSPGDSSSLPGNPAGRRWRRKR